MNIFKTHPNLSKAFFTSDDQPFYNLNAAENHAKTLTDKKVRELSPEDFLEDEPSQEKKNLMDLLKADLLEMAEGLNIDTVDSKNNKAEIVEAIESAQNPNEEESTEELDDKSESAEENTSKEGEEKELVQTEKED